jgi:DNA polymerase-3 subunit alpha
LALAGAFDDFPGTHRAQYFYTDPNDSTIFIEKLIRFANQYQSSASSSQQSLFGETSTENMPDPELPDCPKWFPFEILQKEKDVVGFYVSGHPLDQYRIEMTNFVNTQLVQLRENLKKYENCYPVVAGIISNVTIRRTKDGKEYANFVLEDYTDNYTFSLFSENYLKFKHLLNSGNLLMIKLTVNTKYNQPNQLEARIANMELLDDVLEKYVKKLTVYLLLNQISPDFTKSFSDKIEKNKGGCPVEIQVFDPDTRDYLPMTSPKLKVSADRFLKWMDKSGGLKYRIN